MTIGLASGAPVPEFLPARTASRVPHEYGPKLAGVVEERPDRRRWGMSAAPGVYVDTEHQTATACPPAGGAFVLWMVRRWLTGSSFSVTLWTLSCCDAGVTDVIVDPMTSVDDILRGVSGLREQIEDGGRRSEELRTCPADLVALLREAGLFCLKVPAELGGVELPFVDQMRVFEEVARLDSNVGWTVMIGNGAAGLVSVRLCDEAVGRVFAGSTPPLTAAALFPPGVAIPDGDGYVVSGRLSFASGIRHAEWVALGALIADEAGAVDPSIGVRMFVVPRDQVTVHDNWDVAGLQGTGSCDFSVERVRVEPEFVLDPLNGEAHRGGPGFRVPPFLFLANEHIGFAARRRPASA